MSYFVIVIYNPAFLLLNKMQQNIKFHLAKNLLIHTLEKNKKEPDMYINLIMLKAAAMFEMSEFVVMLFCIPFPVLPAAWQHISFCVVCLPPAVTCPMSSNNTDTWLNLSPPLFFSQSALVHYWRIAWLSVHPLTEPVFTKGLWVWVCFICFFVVVFFFVVGLPFLPACCWMYLPDQWLMLPSSHLLSLRWGPSSSTNTSSEEQQHNLKESHCVRVHLFIKKLATHTKAHTLWAFSVFRECM